MLTEAGYDVLLASDIDPIAADEYLLSLATRERRIIITEDKDFGELVFAQGLPHWCVIRFVEIPATEKAECLRELIDNHSDSMLEGAFIVVTQNRVRIRQNANYGRQ